VVVTGDGSGIGEAICERLAADGAKVAVLNVNEDAAKRTAFIASYCETPRILREATAATFTTNVESSLKAFLRTRTTAFRVS